MVLVVKFGFGEWCKMESKSVLKRLKVQKKNYKMEVRTDSTDNWSSNACVYATEREALDAGDELMGRWMLVREYRAVTTDDPVNYRMVDGRPQSIRSIEGE